MKKLTPIQGHYVLATFKGQKMSFLFSYMDVFMKLKSQIYSETRL